MQNYMPPEAIGKAYDTITHLWQSERFNLNNGIDAHKKALQFVKGNTGQALDVGCGCTGRFANLLQGAGYRYTGLDVSEKKIELARVQSPSHDFIHADICQWQPQVQYDFITAWDSIWHIPLQQQQPVLEKLVNSLKPNGVFIFSCGGTDEPGDHTDDYMGPAVYYSSLGVNGFWKVFADIENCLIKHFEFDQPPELHSYFIVQKGENV